MRKSVFFIIITILSFSCNNGKVDEQKVNEAGEKLQKTVKKVVDSAETKIERLKDKVEKNQNDTTY